MMEPLLILRQDKHTSELQSLMRISYDAFCLKQKPLSVFQNKMRLFTYSSSDHLYRHVLHSSVPTRCSSVLSGGRGSRGGDRCQGWGRRWVVLMWRSLLGASVGAGSLCRRLVRRSRRVVVAAVSLQFKNDGALVDL